LGTTYTHGKLVAGLGFGFWRYLFAQHQYQYAGSTLLQIFPAKPRSTATMQYNQRFVFNQLDNVNKIRNRIAHHEPICFKPSLPMKDTTYAQQHYGLILQLFQILMIKFHYIIKHVQHFIGMS
jgi:hypothetical protein